MTTPYPQNVDRLNGEYRACGPCGFCSFVHDLLNLSVKFGFSRSLLSVNGNDSKNIRLDGCFVVLIKSVSKYFCSFQNWRDRFAFSTK